MKSIKIVIADDHWMVRDGIKQLLELENEFKVIAEAGNGTECLQILEDIEANVLLLDINMPEKNGLEVLSEMKKRNSKIKTVVLTIQNEAEYVNKAMELGAHGYVLKDSSSDELKKAIYQVLKALCQVLGCEVLCTPTNTDIRAIFMFFNKCYIFGHDK